ncbi:GspH/FimT family pseudopilin [Bradyrhizobium sp. AZCC 1678]|uniref:GspH/FimT family pseudopilin n=1 Tax=Bradyrhizobium sp. AZCC 1678 TaxID=3117030 RepID=UPI002FF2BF13
MAGFTLIEMLVVLAILALGSVLALPALRPPPDDLRLEAAARTVTSALRLSRTRAIAVNADVVLTIDAGRRLLESSAVSAIHIDPEISIEMILAAPERRARSIGAIRFFADGTSSGGDIVLALGARRARILVNWLTGQARLDLAGVGSL